jgi:hypothetical protein
MTKTYELSTTISSAGGRDLYTVRQSNSRSRRAEAKALRESLKIGFQLHTSWGYEQTNVEFYEVVGFFGALGVVLRQVAVKTVRRTGDMSDVVRPVPGRFLEDEEPIRKRITGGGIRLDECRTAWPSDSRQEFHRSWYA